MREEFAQKVLAELKAIDAILTRGRERRNYESALEGRLLKFETSTERRLARIEERLKLTDA